ncbi:MAG: hypothetical protein CMO30_07600 [Tistrella sp.]|nr:hypothetical protein [Tistrella sp.]
MGVSMDDSVGPVPLPAASAIVRAHEVGDSAMVAELVEQAPLEAWFGIAPPHLREILDAVPPRLLATGSAARTFRIVLHGPVDERSVGSAPTADAPGGEIAALFFDARARGDAQRALDLRRRFGERMNALFDETGGIATFAGVQIGIAQMLAGNFVEALESFTMARRTAPPAPLTALLRDAYVKPAMVHSLFGDPQTALRKLDASRSLSPTESWVEPVITAHAEIARATISADEDLRSAIESTESIPLPLLGELWPYRVEALFRLYLRTGRLDEAWRSVEAFRPAASGLVPGNGMPGSVFATTAAVVALREGRIARARALIREADPKLVSNELLRNAIEVAAGDLDHSIQRLIGLRARTRRLRQLEFARTALLAWAVLRRGDDAEATRILRDLLDRHHRIFDAERALVPLELATFAEHAIPGWLPAHGSGRSADAWPDAVPRLTPREHQVLALMASDMTRTEIAESMFVSVNTVKSQQRAVFRKLGVNTRLEALMTAERLGLL